MANFSSANEKRDQSARLPSASETNAETQEAESLRTDGGDVVEVMKRRSGGAKQRTNRSKSKSNKKYPHGNRFRDY